jgi:plasmid maintenance system killer protein
LEIVFADNKLMKECNDWPLLLRRHGTRRAKLIRLRLDELRAADTLYDIRYLPGPRCHELCGNLQGRLSLDLDHPYRLIFEPANDPVPRKIDGGLDWSRLTAVRILEVRDTHE